MFRSLIDSQRSFTQAKLSLFLTYDDQLTYTYCTHIYLRSSATSHAMAESHTKRGRLLRLRLGSHKVAANEEEQRRSDSVFS